MCDLKVYYYSSVDIPEAAEEREIEASKKDEPCDKGEDF